MSFKEKSAWIMVIAIGFSCLFYFSHVIAQINNGILPSPSTPAIITYTALQVGIVIIGHIIIAALKPKEAHIESDERERQLEEKASSWATVLFTVVISLALASYLIKPNGDLLFFTVFASLNLAHFADYLFQIYFHRKI